MGNRAFIVFDEGGQKPDHGVYLHWNGGPESVLAFLQSLIDRRWTRMDYVSARFCAVASEFFDSEGGDGGLSLGIMGFNPKKPNDSDPGDNGIYYVKGTEKGFEVKHHTKVYKMPFFDAVETSGLEKFSNIVGTIARARIGRVRETKNHLESKKIKTV